MVFWQQRPDAVVIRYGVPCAPLVQAVCDELRRQTDVREAVVFADMALASELVGLEHLRMYVEAQSSSTTGLITAVPGATLLTSTARHGCVPPGSRSPE